MDFANKHRIYMCSENGIFQRNEHLHLFTDGDDCYINCSVVLMDCIKGFKFKKLSN